MDDLLSKVLELQSSWTATNTEEMQERGLIIRQQLPDHIRADDAWLSAALGVSVGDLGVEGRDGTGLKSEIPWVRVFGREQSPSSTIGWYVVYLFSASGQRVHLSLNQGTTIWTGGVFKPRKPEGLRARVEWAVPLLAQAAAARPDVHGTIELDARTPLGRGYGPGNVLAITYERDQLPAQETLAEDLRFMTGLLGILYEAERQAPYIPGDPTPEVLEAEQSAAKTAGRRIPGPARPRRVGQGFLLTSGERRAIERHSVRMASEYFAAQGWTVKDVGDKESFDLLLTKEGQRLHVEVKGTTSAGLEVILTRAEVEKQRKYFPANALVVVHSIGLDRTEEEPTTSGGVLHCTSPWAVNGEDLTVISYAYRTNVGTQPSVDWGGEQTLLPPDVPQQRQTQEKPQIADGGPGPL
ncbi:MrcB family domain-containing protein [Streptomyces sp. enrichment culture]|uniref:MrcB family domain-containing protein n=1 Tax=Streptomyces sp. enrichment culture TaxID=1795815 RepID=UPI003F554F08